MAVALKPTSNMEAITFFALPGVQYTWACSHVSFLSVTASSSSSLGSFHATWPISQQHRPVLTASFQENRVIAGTRNVEPFWLLLQRQIKELVWITNGTLRHASSSQIIATNIPRPTLSFFTDPLYQDSPRVSDLMSDLSPFHHILYWQTWLQHVTDNNYNANNKPAVGERWRLVAQQKSSVRSEVQRRQCM